MVNCWLLYRRDCKDMEIPAKNVMKLQEFKLSLAEALLLEGKRPCRKKRGRPSNAASVSLQHDKKLKSSPATKAIPSAEVRTDGYHHFADVVTRGRCKNPEFSFATSAKYIFVSQKTKIASRNSILNEPVSHLIPLTVMCCVFSMVFCLFFVLLFIFFLFNTLLTCLRFM